MLYNCASRCADFLLKYSTINPKSKAVYVYGFELLFSTCGGVLSILLIAAITNSLAIGVIFLTIFVLLRVFCGGYHATTYGRCFLSSNLTFISVLIFTNISAAFAQKPIALCFVAAASVVIVLFAPVQNKKHPLSQTKLQKNRKIALVILVVFISVFFAMYFGNASLSYLFGFSLSLTAVAVCMIIPKISERRKGHE